MAALHPQIVHFVVALTLVGVAFRVLSLLGRPAFLHPAAATLLILAGVSAFAAARSGTAAHAPVERVPGSRPAVEEHEEWGENTQFVLMGLGALELLALALSRSAHRRKVQVVSAVVGLGAVFAVYQTSKAGGELVYNYAGGVGLRSGNPEDVQRLLLAGYYHQAMAERKAGRASEAAALIDEAKARYASDPEVQTLAAESLLVDRKNPQGALDALATINPGNRRVLRGTIAGLQADAYEALGQKDKAISTLETFLSATPNARLQRRLDGLKGGSAK